MALKFGFSSRTINILEFRLYLFLKRQFLIALNNLPKNI